MHRCQMPECACQVEQCQRVFENISEIRNPALLPPALRTGEIRYYPFRQWLRILQEHALQAPERRIVMAGAGPGHEICLEPNAPCASSLSWGRWYMCSMKRVPWHVPAVAYHWTKLENLVQGHSKCNNDTLSHGMPRQGMAERVWENECWAGVRHHRHTHEL